MKLKSACLLLGLCHAGSAAAIGLGEIGVRSFLGQPLHATVPLLDVPAAATADCFSLEASVGGIAPPPRAQLSIEQSGGQAVLHIRTRHAINDPIAQFVLVSDCEARLQRDYVVLLDPPAVVASPLGHDAAAMTAAAVEAPPVAALAPRPARAQRRTQRAPAVAARPPAAAARQSAAPRPQAAAAAAAPRLVLSGKREVPPATGTATPGQADAGPSDQAHAHSAKLDATELSDENTALTRKLAHLEAQLAALQRRHAELEARRAAAAAAATAAPPPPERPAQWPLYLLAIGLLGGGALAAWLRRRQAALADDAAWARPDTGTLKTLSEMTLTPPAKLEPVPQRMPEIAPPPLAAGTEVKEDILDQAEVFMAHGHGELAVHLLQEHLRAAPGESPVPWLLLLDLLHREGDTAGYTAASAECRRYFNINLTGHPVSQDNEQSQGLEAYPHLLEQMVKVWSTPDIGAFFHDLIYDNRGGTRIGFEPGAYRDILLLREVSQQRLALAA